MLKQAKGMSLSQTSDTFLNNLALLAAARMAAKNPHFSDELHKIYGLDKESQDYQECC